jgi:hypothetical protein
MESTNQEEHKTEDAAPKKAKALNKFYDHVKTLGQGAYGTAH